MKSLTIKDIASLAHVSIGTVSRIINETGSGYSRETYERVKRVIANAGYVPNHMLRNAGAKRSHTIGLVMLDIANPSLPEIITGIEEVALAADLDLLLCNSNDNPAREQRQLALLLEKRVEGILLMTSALCESRNVDELLRAGVPFVLLNANSVNSCCNVSIDNYNGAKQLVSYLIARGHQRIACITGPDWTEGSQPRCRGYKQALTEHNLPVVQELIVSGDDDTLSGGSQAMQKLKGTDYTAVFACNDMMAIGVYHYLYTHGLSVPQDVSVVGFGDIPPSAMICPPLTTMHQPTVEMGRAAMRLLLQVMAQPKGTPVTSRSFPLEFMERDSVASPSR
ncbi:MAG: LacI family transcriptional regulator [Anaerotruncus sp.]|nr:LacI family transcriptional regulator [Anaerotruncus sp.]